MSVNLIDAHTINDNKSLKCIYIFLCIYGCIFGIGIYSEKFYKAFLSCIILYFYYPRKYTKEKNNILISENKLYLKFI